MKENYADRLRREALEKKVERRQYQLKATERLQETYKSNLATNSAYLESQRQEVAAAEAELRAFNGETVEPSPIQEQLIEWTWS